MGNMNSVCISGNLTRDPELRSSASGVSFLNFSVAVNERRKNAESGEYEDRPNYFDCVAIGKRAEGLSTFLTIGMKVAVKGRLQWRAWEDPEGKKRSAVSIVVDEIDVMQRKGEEQGSRPTYDAPTGEPTYEDDIPF